MTAEDAGTGLVARLDTPLPARALADRPNLVFVSGSCRCGDGRPTAGLDLVLDGRATAAMAHSMPRPDVSATAGPNAFRSGFWGIVPLPAAERRRTVALELTASLDDGSKRRVPVGSIELEPGPTDTAGPTAGDSRPARIAICMATYEPPIDLLERQIDSIRAQTNEDWICVISDDDSEPQTLAAIERLVGGDSRFLVSSAAPRRGFFHNFERALRLAPETEFVAFADQDDRWDPEKLELLLSRIGEATVVYSDARIVTPSGEVLSETYWSQRPNNNDNFVSLLLANTVSGSAALFRREVVERALPFPYSSGGLFHDHWLATVGLALGPIAYVDQPLYDYVQHDAALLGHERAQAWANGARSLPVRLRHFRGDPDYFYEHWRTTYFQEYCRISLMARLLLTRCRAELSPARSAALGRLIRAERSATSAAWLAGRQLRGLAGDSETLGAEGRLLRALAWKHMLAAQPAQERETRRWLPRRGAFPVDRLSPTIPPPATATVPAPAPPP